MARFELSEGTSSKFWEIELAGDSFSTTYGRIGAKGQTTTKTFPTPEKARVEHDKLVAEKLKKGYRLVSGASGPSYAPAAAPTPLGTREDVIRRIRQRRILAAFYPM
ncbi:MAG TPA: WGR domain-containing protein [Minicystis sp.]|nr:WGR domain-containing protein [Minicystis sp.]